MKANRPGNIAKRALLASATALALGVSGALAQGGDDAERIAAARQAYNDAIARHDVNGIVSFLDDEYQITTSLGDLLQDRDGEAAAWQALIDSREDVLYVRTPTSIDVSQDYPLASERGSWVGTWTTAEGAVQTGGNYSAMWRKTDGGWKVRSELFVALYCDGAGCP